MQQVSTYIFLICLPEAVTQKKNGDGIDVMYWLCITSNANTLQLA